MLNYEQATNIINIIKNDINNCDSDPKKAKQLCQAIYTYLNQAGGYSPIPNELQTYKNVLSVFKNPYTILTSLRGDFPSNVFFDDKIIKQEIQTIVLLWLREATTRPIKDIDLHIIINQCNSIH